MGKKILIVMSLLFVVGLLVGCSGVKKADLDAAKAQVNTLQNEVNTLQTQLNAANAAKSQADANKSLVRSYYDALNAGDTKSLAQIFAPDYKRYLTATAAPLTLDAQMKRLAGLRAVFPDMQITVDNIIAEGDYVAISMTVRGTQKVAFQGIPPTGKQGTVTAIEIIHIVNGKFVEHWGGTDNLDLMQQLGAVLTVPK